MALRTRHGNAKQYGTTPVLETLPVNELPVGAPGEARQESPGDRGQGGRFAPGNSLARAGGKAKAGKSRLATRLGLKKLPDTCAVRPYRASGETFRLVSNATIAATVGGGVCSAIPSSMVASGSIALGWSRYYLDIAAELSGDPEKAARFVELGIKLAEASSSMIRQAHEYAAKEATARQARAPAGPAVGFLEATEPEGK